MKIAKDCPFCGEDIGPVVARQGTKYTFYQVMHQPNKKGHRHGLIIMDVDEWNTRPIEDALNARIAELEAEIAKLKAENAKLETERRWIPLNERQPEVGSNVVLVNANKGKEYYALQVSEWMVDELDMFHTHWMRLPEPPEVGE